MNIKLRLKVLTDFGDKKTITFNKIDNPENANETIKYIVDNDLFAFKIQQVLEAKVISTKEEEVDLNLE